MLSPSDKLSSYVDDMLCKPVEVAPHSATALQKRSTGLVSSILLRLQGIVMIKTLTDLLDCL
jgi:hypothetical protein